MNCDIEVPDGGRGWTVVAGAALINIFNQSLLSMFGLIFGGKLERLAGTTGVTTVMSINCTISNFSGFLIGPLEKYLSTKQITQIGVLLVSFGFILSGYTNSYIQIMIGYGISTGLGLGLIQSSTFLIINSYFKRNKSQAVGLAMAGTSVGQMGMPLVVAWLLDYFGFDGTTLILAGLSLHGLIGTMFFDPVEKHAKVNIEARFLNVLDDSEKCNTSENTRNNTNKILEQRKKSSSTITKRDSDTCNLENGENIHFVSASIQIRDGNSWCTKFVQFFNIQILADPIFVHIMIGLSLAYTTSISFSTFFPLFLTNDQDLSMFDASSCMSILSLTDFIGRLIIPLVSKYLGLSHRKTFTLASLALAVSRSVLVIQADYIMIMTFSAICGLARAATVINQNLVIAEYSNTAHISSAVGLNMVSKGIFVLTIGRLLGRYKDSAHNYAACIHILDLISISVVSSWTFEFIVKFVLK